jgi:ABC-2 type transport system ATP-binding protein
MRRRLDLAASLVGRPDVLFLDEPTTGLDPRSRLDVWDFIRELQAEGTTLLLTTQYLDEADQLADRIAVIDLGKVIAEGTSDELKAHVGGEVLELHLEKSDELKLAAEALAGVGTGETNVDADAGLIRVPVGDDGPAVLLECTRRLDERKIVLTGFALHRPTLDDVFLALTGHAAEDASAPEPAAKGRRARRKGGES